MTIFGEAADRKGGLVQQSVYETFDTLLATLTVTRHQSEKHNSL